MGKSNNRSKPKLSKYEAPKQRRVSKEQIQNATYKDVKLLEKFLSDRGKIRSSLITGITKQEQAKNTNPILKTAEDRVEAFILRFFLTNK